MAWPHINITVRPEQDAWMRAYARMRGLTLSGAYQEVIKRAMAAAAFFVDAETTEGSTVNHHEEVKR